MWDVCDGVVHLVMEIIQSSRTGCCEFKTFHMLSIMSAVNLHCSFVIIDIVVYFSEKELSIVDAEELMILCGVNRLMMADVSLGEKPMIVALITAGKAKSHLVFVPSTEASSALPVVLDVTRVVESQDFDSFYSRGMCQTDAPENCLINSKIHY